MNKKIEMLYNVLDNKDKIINEQVLEIARLKGKSEILEENNKLLIQQKQQMYEDLDIAYDKIDKAREYIGNYEEYCDEKECYCTPKYFEYLLDILGDKENEDIK